jgi:hypothetical protein
MKGRLCGASNIMLMNVGLPGVHPVGDLLCLAHGREDGALEYLGRVLINRA